MEMIAEGHDFGVYVHIPFCASRCDYCAFVTNVGKLDRADAYVAAVVREIEGARSSGRWRIPSTVFVGGGTPSLLPKGALAQVLAAIDAPVGAEVTVEANPESATRWFLEEARGSGVTRISLGAQSFVEHVRVGLGRQGDAAAIPRAVREIGALGFPSFNVDLIYGAPAERDEDFEETLDALLALEPTPPHVSGYALTVEAGTPLSRDPSRHPDDDVLARRYEAIDDRLEAAGYRWYEISNWAKPGHECQHNVSCWHGGEYLGFGCAAHGHFDGERFANVASFERYITRVNDGYSPVAWRERLGETERVVERLELALRTRDGVPNDALFDDPALDGLVARTARHAVLTRRGRLLANEVTLRLRPS
ncbi:MAG: radical SAM family heme chaperone HemW [Acidimicrobiales bacterium]